MLASSMSSYSEPYIGPAGYGTHVKIITGSKLWIMQSTEAGAASRAHIPKLGESWNANAAEWCAAHLQAGDILCVLSELVKLW